MSIDRDACASRDRDDPLAPFRRRFTIPDGLVYLDGNSLGALPRDAVATMRRVVEQEWGDGLVRSWLSARWMEMPERVGGKVARLVGALPGEVVVGESTTVCLYKLIDAALHLRRGRSVVLTEAENFHSDLYVATAAAEANGATLRVVPRGEVRAAIDGDVAVLLLTHVDFRSGAMHDMAAMSAVAHDHGALAVWDLSHSTGAVPLALERDGADMATGCGYKYLNGGPGAPAFMYVRRALQEGVRNPIPGWLGHHDPFAFDPSFLPAQGIRRMVTGSPHVLQLSALEAALDLWLEVDMAAVRRKSVALAELFIELVEERCAGAGLELASPRDPWARGSHVSFAHRHGYGIMRALIERDVIGDFRDPDICRFGLAPLYNSFVDVWDAVERLRLVLETAAHRDPRHDTRVAIT